MKIGVALSGCDVGGISAWCVLQTLAQNAVKIDMISACCVPATTSLLYAQGCDKESMQSFSENFIDDYKSTDIDYAVANLSAMTKCAQQIAVPIAINAVNVLDGRIVTFTEDYDIHSEMLDTYDLADTYDILSATMSLMDGLGSYRLGERKLCDFCCWYGCPYYPLRLAGMDKIISVSFEPKYPKTPYEVLVKQMIKSTSATADIHISIEFPGRDMEFSDYKKIAEDKTQNFINKIMFHTLF